MWLQPRPVWSWLAGCDRKQGPESSPGVSSGRGPLFSVLLWLLAVNKQLDSRRRSRKSGECWRENRVGTGTGAHVQKAFIGALCGFGFAVRRCVWDRAARAWFCRQGGRAGNLLHRRVRADTGQFVSPRGCFSRPPVGAPAHELAARNGRHPRHAGRRSASGAISRRTKQGVAGYGGALRHLAPSRAGSRGIETCIRGQHPCIKNAQRFRRLRSICAELVPSVHCPATTGGTTDENRREVVRVRRFSRVRAGRCTRSSPALPRRA